MWMTMEEMIRGLVAAAEILEQRNAVGAPYNECYRALATARTLGWGKGLTGKLGEMEPLDEQVRRLRNALEIITSTQQNSEASPLEVAHEMASIADDALKYRPQAAELIPTVKAWQDLIAAPDRQRVKKYDDSVCHNCGQADNTGGKCKMHVRTMLL